MDAPVFVGDEPTGAGFRLAGIRTMEATAETAEAVFERALEMAPLVIITAGIAGILRADRLAMAVSRATPPVAIVPSASGGPETPDMESEVRAALGVET